MNSSSGGGRLTEEISTSRIVARLLVGFVVLSAALFGTAGTLEWPEAWFYLILQFSFSVTISGWLKRNNPQLLKDRMTFFKPAARSWDKFILWISAILLVPYLLIPGFDAVRFQWSLVPPVAKVVAFAGAAAAFLLIGRVMRENRYLSPIVEVQKDRGHRAITTGPYEVVRHPMYIGVIGLLAFIPVALGSFWALLPAVPLILLIIVRTDLEDRTLQKELEGYQDYTLKVPYRLVPGIW